MSAGVSASMNFRGWSMIQRRKWAMARIVSCHVMTWS
jgi:hypothetical protein